MCTIGWVSDRNGCSFNLGSFPTKARLPFSIVKIVLIDDLESWRRFAASSLEERPEFRIVGEAADGLEAVQKVKELQPDLILLDIGLPKLNGIEAAKRIRECAPKTRILFFSQNCSRDIAEEAMRTGDGYVVKSEASYDLLPAVQAVLQGKQFRSTLLSSERRSKMNEK